VNAGIHEEAVADERTTPPDPLALSMRMLRDALDFVREAVDVMATSSDPVRRASARAGVARLVDLERAVVALDRVVTANRAR
jgi:hypothetical protein